MKKLFTIITLLVSLTLTAQEVGDNAVVISTDLNFEDAFRQTGRLLAQNGFSIEYSDDTFGTITTKGRQLDSRLLEPIWYMHIDAIVGDGEIILTSKLKNNSTTLEAKITRMRSTWPVRGFQELIEFAELFPGGEISFEKR